MKTQIFVIAAVTLMASAASAAEQMAPTWKLPDGSTMAVIQDGKTALFRNSSSTTILLHCTPGCAVVKVDTSFSAGIVADVSTRLAGGLGYYPAAKAFRPSSTNLYNGSSSYSDAYARGGQGGQGGVALNDFSSRANYYGYGGYYSDTKGEPVSPALTAP